MQSLFRHRIIIQIRLQKTFANVSNERSKLYWTFTKCTIGNEIKRIKLLDIYGEHLAIWNIAFSNVILYMQGTFVHVGFDNIM